MRVLPESDRATVVIIINVHNTTAPHRTYRTGPDRTGPDRTGPHRTAPHRTAPHRR